MKKQSNIRKSLYFKYGMSKVIKNICIIFILISYKLSYSCNIKGKYDI